MADDRSARRAPRGAAPQPPEIEVPPGRVTEVTPSPRRPGRFDLAVDGRVVATVSLEAVERLDLHAGTILDPARAAAVAREATETRVYDRALAMLASRGRSAGELRRLLVRKGEESSSVDGAIERLRAVGFLDDAQFARQFARARGSGAGLSRRRIASELSRRGVARDVADEAIEEVFEQEAVDESGNLDRVARRKLRLLEKHDPETRRRRLFAFLARRGYDPDEIRDAVRRLLAE